MATDRGLLARHSAVDGVLFDQPEVVANAGVLLRRFGKRCRVVGGSFFGRCPSMVSCWCSSVSSNENAPPKLSDLNMLVNPGGRERSEGEYAALFTAAGLRYMGGTPTAAGVMIFSVRCSTCRSFSCCARTASQQIAQPSSACFPQRRHRDCCGRLLQLRRLARAGALGDVPGREGMVAQ